MQKPQGKTLSQVLSALVLVPLGGLFGMLVGGLFVRLFVPRRGMGWDQLADFLGGVMVGGLVGLVLALVLCFYLTARSRWWTAGALLLAGALIVLTLRVLSPAPEAEGRDHGEPPPAPRPTTKPADGPGA
ncbi:MAG: hypothetical protein AAF604_07545 [Acidobacteriota bacterium]